MHAKYVNVNTVPFPQLSLPLQLKVYNSHMCHIYRKCIVNSRDAPSQYLIGYRLYQFQYGKKRPQWGISRVHCEILHDDTSADVPRKY